MRVIILDSQEARRHALDVVRTITIAEGMPVMCIEIKLHEDKRRAEQNRLHWARLEEFAEQCRPEGVEYEPKLWHIYFCERFLPMVEIGLPNGKTVLRRKSTTDLSVAEFTDLMTKIEAFAANREIIFTDDGG